MPLHGWKNKRKREKEKKGRSIFFGATRGRFGVGRRPLLIGVGWIVDICLVDPGVIGNYFWIRSEYPEMGSDARVGIGILGEYKIPIMNYSIQHFKISKVQSFKGSTFQSLKLSPFKDFEFWKLKVPEFIGTRVFHHFRFVSLGIPKTICFPWYHHILSNICWVFLV